MSTPKTVQDLKGQGRKVHTVCHSKDRSHKCQWQEEYRHHGKDLDVVSLLDRDFGVFNRLPGLLNTGPYKQLLAQVLDLSAAVVDLPDQALELEDLLIEFLPQGAHLFPKVDIAWALFLLKRPQRLMGPGPHLIREIILVRIYHGLDAVLDDPQGLRRPEVPAHVSKARVLEKQPLPHIRVEHKI